MRIFVGISCPPELRKEAEVWQQKHRELKVRWVASSDLHMTLVAPWEEGDIEGAASRIRDAAQGFAPFDILFTSISYGPSPREPRLIWASGEESQPAAALAERLCLAFGSTPRRRFTPHVTLARFDPQAFHLFPVKDLKEKISWRSRAYAVTLFGVPHLGRDYVILAQVPLH